MKLYLIYIYNDYEDSQLRETVAIATTPENRDDIISSIPIEKIGIMD